MIIPTKTLEAVDDLFNDPQYNESDLLVHCGSDGLYIGKIFLNRKLILATEKKTTFKKALYSILEACAKTGETE